MLTLGSRASGLLFWVHQSINLEKCSNFYHEYNFILQYMVSLYKLLDNFFYDQFFKMGRLR